ncbi:MAG: calcium-translocating P-type ATPase, PMCA-type [Acidimicrobiales bacterium]|nr:calcium-translocating P-type ATPase, PMCA-type [Acidimicrobiales bacterium]
MTKSSTLPAAVDLTNGLTDAEVAESRQRAGANSYSPLPKKSVFDFVWAAFKDPMLQVLIVAALISIGLGFRHNDYLDGIAITIAVLVVVGVGTMNELRAQRDYAELENISAQESIRVVRNGHVVELATTELVVGDVVEVNVGDVLSSDLEFARGTTLLVSEAQITGEPETRKNLGDDLFGSSRILDGSGRAIVKAVGDDTVFGRIRTEISEADKTTPLQERLEDFAGKIGMVGAFFAVLTFVALLFSDLVRDELDFAMNLEFWERALEILTIAVTIVVVTVPEGLPLAVTLSLAYTTRRMAQEQALVRELAACETMGAATIVCSDKTGTLTYGHMDVAWLWIDGQEIRPDAFCRLDSVDKAVLARAISVNSTADLVERDGEIIVAGNSTEGALLQMLASHDHEYHQIREGHDQLERIEFNSERKYMATVADVNGLPEAHVKGAPEIVLGMCATTSDHDAILAHVDDAARRGYRTLGFASGPDLDNLTFIGLAVLADAMRDEVPASVQRCRNAGVDVMMITGDIAATAFEIARQAGIADTEDQVLTGPDLRAMTDHEITERLDRTKVIARALPEDKSRMTHILQEAGEVVAMTGDGVNDAPALVAADVGFSMGSGSKVAREASDIVVVDDDFTTIVRAIRWGRAVFENIRKFLQFQLTVNVVALGVAFTAALAGYGTPLTPVQLLWVNLIMDSLAAIALTLTPPSDTLYEQAPHGRDEPLISRFMWINIIGLGVYMFGVVWLVLGTDLLADGARDDIARTSVVFNVFVFLQVFNAFNARTVRPRRNPFAELASNTSFLFIIGLIILSQVVIMLIGGSVFDTQNLTANQWLWSVLIGATVLPMGFVVRRIAAALRSAENRA